MTQPLPVSPTAMNPARSRTRRARVHALTLLLAVTSPIAVRAQQTAGAAPRTALSLDDAIRAAEPAPAVPVVEPSPYDVPRPQV